MSFGHPVSLTLSLKPYSVLTLMVVLDPQQRTRINRSQMVQDQIVEKRVLSVNYFPKESRLVTFRDPWSFPVLFHPACNHLIRAHLEDIAQKVGRILAIFDFCSIR